MALQLVSSQNFFLECPRQVANDLMIMPSKNEVVNKNSYKGNNNFLFKVISILLLSMQ